jgi:hypothetical protein
VFPTDGAGRFYNFTSVIGIPDENALLLFAVLMQVFNLDWPRHELRIFVVAENAAF